MNPANWIWKPNPQEIQRTNVWRFLTRLGFTNQQDFLRWSHESIEDFWREMAEEARIEWFVPFERVLDASRGPEWTQWFSGGRLNIVHNCLDRHCTSTQPAILWEREKGDTGAISFDQLSRDVQRLANYLKSLGYGQGDRVALCMPMVPEVVTILYACLKLGIVAVPIFAGFGAGAIATRLADSGALAVFTTGTLERRGKILPLEEKVRKAAEGLPVRIVTAWEDAPTSCETVALDSEATAMLLYTSGTSGKPKGTVHTHAGTLVQTAKEIWLAFDHRPDDRFFWLSDIGWMMGPWMILGTHNFGGTIFLYDGAPDYPGPDRLWQMIERHGITTIGVSPTAIRSLMRSSDPSRYSLHTLRLLGSTGEPWDETSYRWFFENIGGTRCPIINICGGTEIIGSFLFPLPIQPLKACTVGGPAPGMDVDIVDDSGTAVPAGQMGYLVCKKPSPSMTRGVWGDPARYLEAYWSKWPGMWHHGDWVMRDWDGCWYVHGRADESMNVAGRKVGPGEIEEALIEHPSVLEAAVIGVPDEIKGEAIVGFVVLNEHPTPELLNDAAAKLVDVMGPMFNPKALLPVRELPKTQSGKILRRLIRQKYLGEPLGDLSTAQNPAALDQFGPSGTS